MKNIFKKNQVIITALAVMIVIAGYLTFTRDKAPVKDASDIVAETTNPDTEELTASEDGLITVEGTDVAQGTTDTDITTTDDTTTDDTTTTDITDDTTVDDTNTTTDTNASEDDTTAISAEDEIGELGDVSDQDIKDLETSQIDVADNGELNIESEDGDVVGEAVLASTTIDASYFNTAKLNREQARAKIKENYLDLIENVNISESQKKDAIDNMLKMTTNVEKESATEILLEAKGFDGVVVSILDGSADVIINAANITDQQIAIIEDVVTRKTDIKVDKIAITPVVVVE